MEHGFQELEAQQRATGFEEAEALTVLLDALNPGAQRCAAGWSALQKYSASASESLEAMPFDPRGVEAQVLALGDLHRKLLGSGAMMNDPLGAGLAARSAREMRAAHDTRGAFAAAGGALNLLAEELSLTHGEHAATVAAAAQRFASLPIALEAELRAEADRLKSELHTLDQEFQMEAAGAGRARPDAKRLADGCRDSLAGVEQQLAALQARRAAMLAGFERYRQRVERSGAATKAWTIAHREAARAILENLPRVHFDLLDASAAELGAR
ncbi:MAG: hypothetical protein O3A20_10330 [Planctomycetota bacterium]|nr:hypothetical protein [Planctomycetota bacterium]